MKGINNCQHDWVASTFCMYMCISINELMHPPFAYHNFSGGIYSGLIFFCVYVHTLPVHGTIVDGNCRAHMLLVRKVILHTLSTFLSVHI